MGGWAWVWVDGSVEWRGWLLGRAPAVRCCRQAAAEACQLAHGSGPQHEKCSNTHNQTHPSSRQRRHNVSLLAYSPLAGGALSGKYVKGDAPKTARFNLFPG